MPVHYPSAQDLHVNRLTELGIAYGQDIKEDYLADSATTQVRSGKQGDLYAIWDKGDFFRSEMKLRADGAKSNRAGFRVSTSPFYCGVYALSTTLSDRQKANADSEFQIENAKVSYLIQQSKINRDKKLAEGIFDTGLWTSNTEQTGVAAAPSTNQFLQFNDSSSTPIVTIQDQMEVVYLATGRYPNVLMTNTKVALTLRRHSDFVNRVQYVGNRPAIVTNEDLARIIGIDQVKVGRALENTAAENATATMTRVFGNHILLAYIDFDAVPTVADRRPTAVTTFVWNEIKGVTKEGASIDSWYDKDTKSTIYEVEDGFDCAITANDAGVFMYNAVA